MNLLVDDFLAHTKECGLGFEGEIIADGLLHRINIDSDKRNTLNGWYVYHDETIPLCVFGSWKTGYQGVWSAKHHSEQSKAEMVKMKLALAKASRKAKAVRDQENKEAAIACMDLYNNSDQVIEHEYLKNKLINTDPILRQHKDTLLIPVLDRSFSITSLQYIYPNGRKKFHPKGKIKGGFCPIHGDNEIVFICEGFSTGATVNQATGATVLVAFNCGNLLEVVRFATEHYTKSSIIIAADDDFATENNVGKHHAKKAAMAYRCPVVYPEFISYQRRKEQTDFNDMHENGISHSIENHVRDSIFRQLTEIK